MATTILQELWPQVYPFIQRVLSQIKTSDKAKSLFVSILFMKKLNLSYESFSAAAGNHAFDDFPEIFGITKKEGHLIRTYFQHDSTGEEFPDGKKSFEDMVRAEGLDPFL